MIAGSPDDLSGSPPSGTPAQDGSVFLYLLRSVRPGMVVEGPDEREAEILERHVDYLQRQSEAGVVVLAGRTRDPDPSSFGIVVLQAAGREAARIVMREDPAVREGIMEAELYPFRIACGAAALASVPGLRGGGAPTGGSEDAAL